MEEAKKNQLDFIKKVQLEIATTEDINLWSSGEVTKPETINYKSHKPEKEGLFDEKIFGPTKDFRCPVCGKKHKRSDVGKPCSSCGESIIESKMVRRRKMGHIQLAAPVAHIWFSKVDYSVIRSVLGVKQKDYDDIIYFKSHVVIDNGGLTKVKDNTVISIQNAASTYGKILKEILSNTADEKLRIAIDAKLKNLLVEAQSVAGQQNGIDFYDYNDFIAMVSGVRISTGAEAVRELINNLDINNEIRKIKRQLQTKKQTNNSLYRRLKVLTAFKETGQNPANMIMDIIPVIPPDLRPLIQLDGGRHSTVDINELYRRVIIRNNRLKQWIMLSAPSLIIQNEKRMLQEAVDALLDNTRKASPVMSKENRPLKSLAENLKGKQGRFRQNLLGKRVDYSGRSVIVVGPELELHQVGLPKKMVVKLFEPFIAELLVKEGVTKNIKQAKKLIDTFDNRIWKYAAEVIKGHPVLLNRAPTLHRLSIQAFEPVIVAGKAIKLHPLVTPSFNADFDGDQMAVHLPLSEKAKAEARELMLSNTNILGPKDGRLILSPSQDMVLGTYYLTKTKKERKGHHRVYPNMTTINQQIEYNNLETHAVIAIPLKMYADKFEKEIKAGFKYIVTTTGRVLMNDLLPVTFPYLNNPGEFSGPAAITMIKSAAELEKAFKVATSEFVPFKKGHVHKIIEEVFAAYPEQIAPVLDAFKSIGFKYSMLSGSSMAIKDIVEIPGRIDALKKGDNAVKALQEEYEMGFLTDDQRYLQVLKVWSQVKDEIQQELGEVLANNPDNALYMMMDSGARGNISNFVQLAGLRGSMAKAVQEYAALKRAGHVTRNVEEIPIKSSFKTGLTPFEYFLSTHGARKGLSDTATKTADSGYLTRRLVEAAQDVHITMDDCGTDMGFDVKEIYDTRTGAVIEGLYDRIQGRYLAERVKDIDGNVIEGASKGTLVTPALADKIVESKVKSVNIRSVLTCNAPRGLCKKCFGNDLTTNQVVDKGEAVGIISAQSIGEPGTQLTMRTFHTGGVAGVADITQGFSRLMELVDANKNPKSAAIISDNAGTVSELSVKDTDSQGNPIAWEISVENKEDKVTYTVNTHHVLRVSPGTEIKAGDKITEGSVRLQNLLDTAGRRATQSYLLKELQRLYRIQGIEVNDKYMEVIIRQMLSKVSIVDKGDSKLYASQIISKDQLKEINAELFAKGKKPAYGKPVVMGVRSLPLYSESWLSAASYQRTSDALVSASIAKQIDALHGVKENLIIGKNIPVGTGTQAEGGKYDIFQDIEAERFTNENNEINFDNEELSSIIVE